MRRGLRLGAAAAAVLCALVAGMALLLSLIGAPETSRLALVMAGAMGGGALALWGFDWVIGWRRGRAGGPG